MKKIKLDAFNPLPVVPVVTVGVKVDRKINYSTVAFVTGVNISPPIIVVINWNF